MYTGEGTRLNVQPVTSPAAGAEFSVVPIFDGGSLVQSVLFRFTASAAVANRVPSLVVTDGNRTFQRFQAPAVVAAAGQVTYTAFDGAIPNVGGGGLVTLGWPNGGVWLPQGFVLASSTALLDVADQYDQIVAYVQVMPSGPYYAATPTELTYLEPLDG